MNITFTIASLVEITVCLSLTCVQIKIIFIILRSILLFSILDYHIPYQTISDFNPLLETLKLITILHEQPLLLVFHYTSVQLLVLYLLFIIHILLFYMFEYAYYDNLSRADKILFQKNHTFHNEFIMMFFKF